MAQIKRQERKNQLCSWRSRPLILCCAILVLLVSVRFYCFSDEAVVLEGALMSLAARRDELLRDDLLAVRIPYRYKSGKILDVPVGIENVWEQLLKEGENMLNGTGSPGIAIEVGMHRAYQCVQAAEAGLEAHCFEPSPVNFRRVTRGVNSRPKEVQDRIHLYKMAAASTSNSTVQFSSSGSTGDHVGSFNGWEMKAEDPESAKSKLVTVPTIRLDDVVDKFGKVLVAKIDTQGFEPQVLEGLQKSLEAHKVGFILMEYWPKGIDLMAGTEGQCIGAKLLEQLRAYGYILYQMRVASHPAGPKGAEDYLNQRPNHDLKANCQWYLDLERLLPSESYKMGYWTDIVAVSPRQPISNPVTVCGKALVFPQSHSG